METGAAHDSACTLRSVREKSRTAMGIGVEAYQRLAPRLSLAQLASP
jgi:hypothetical protein